MSELMSLAGNVIQGVLSPALQSKIGKENADWQWNRYYSPRAQVNNLADAGINPAVAFGNQSPVMTSGGQMTMPDMPGLGIGTTSLAEIGSYLNAKASAAKAEKETGKVDAETQMVLSELDAQRLQNELVRQFGQKKWTYDVALAYENVLLARKSNDIKEQEKAMNEYHKVTSYLESQLKGSELTAFKKRLDNLDTEIQLSNKLQTEKISTEKSAQSSNYASARASNTQANVNEQETRLRRALADIEESGSTFKLESLIRQYKRDNAISDADKKEAEVKLQRLKDLESKRDSSLFGEIDSMLEWLKNKVSIFH
jgi:hypothetical protein